ncbi:MAG: hypothetical protein A2X34_03685 [Elusimicrobia bacterium GWC2_51_8]|nr:MAG: hypothetical protein A2X33_11025 [Elusimicrobia bacterium GWA2_51_34]OGR60363.1 MAG: hypothetical protein A2X34_03685 [Elusimicrobia bacterium GWC2_51_8]HAF95126.1 hypothetical protein [Elusimicrobiota bacterium]HCE97203.1 hypothetical protein [Elusimicrobiota bacterium]
MENKIVKMQKTMTVMLMGTLFAWSFFTQGRASFLTWAVALIFILSIFKKTKPVDEREIHLMLLSSYVAWMITLCFILIMQTVEYVRFNHTTNAYGYVMAVLMVSQAAVTMYFMKSSK